MAEPNAAVRASGPLKSPKKAPGPRPPSAATFEEYFWEAYNEIVRPNRFDWYLITRWLPDLGSDGFTLVKVLRNLCYHNRKDGILRDQCDIEMPELAQLCGLKERSLYRLLAENAAVQQFVRRQPRYIVGVVGDGPHRAGNRYRVCMDDPLHPGDQEEYEELRRKRDEERAQGQAAKPIIERPSAYACQGGRDSQPMPATLADMPPSFGSHIPPMPAIMAEHKEEFLPSGIITKESLTPVAPPAIQRPPEGVKTTCHEPLAAAWREALSLLADQVNKPTFEAHIRTLRPVSFSEGGELKVSVPSAFTRNWIEKRHLPAIQAALSTALKMEVTVVLIGTATV